MEDIFHQRTGDRPHGSFANDGRRLAFSYTSHDWSYGPKTSHDEVVVNGVHLVPVEELLKVSKRGYAYGLEYWMETSMAQCDSL